MSVEISFLRIDDRLVHGQVIVGWLPEIKPLKLLVVNDKICDDFMRQEMIALSVPPDLELDFKNVTNISTDDVSESTFLLVSSPEDAWHCLEKGIKPRQFNVGGMHSASNKEEIFEALHVDDNDRKYFDFIIESGVTPIFQPTPQNEPLPLGNII